MATINLSFPDPSYSATVSPSVVTLKADLTLLETAINALDDNNIAAGAGIQYSKLSLGNSIVNADINASAAIAASKLNLTNIASAVRFNNNVELQFEETGGTPEGRIFMDTNDKFLIVGDSSTAAYSIVNIVGAGARHGRLAIKEDGGKKIEIFHDGENPRYISSSGAHFFTMNVDPVTHKGADLGTATRAWDDVYGDDFNNVADYYFFDDRDDVALLKQIKLSNKKDPLTGYTLIDDDTLPDELLKKSKGKEPQEGQKMIPKGEILRDKEGKPYISIKALNSLLIGAVRQLDNRLEKLELK